MGGLCLKNALRSRHAPPKATQAPPVHGVRRRLLEAHELAASAGVALPQAGEQLGASQLHGEGRPLRHERLPQVAGRGEVPERPAEARRRLQRAPWPLEASWEGGRASRRPAEAEGGLIFEKRVLGTCSGQLDGARGNQREAREGATESDRKQSHRDRIRGVGSGLRLRCISSTGCTK